MVAKGQGRLTKFIQRAEQVSAGIVRLKTHRLPVIDESPHTGFHGGRGLCILDKEMLPAGCHTRSGTNSHHGGHGQPALPGLNHPSVVTGQASLRIDDLGEQCPGEQRGGLPCPLGRLNGPCNLVVGSSR